MSHRPTPKGPQPKGPQKKSGDVKVPVDRLGRRLDPAHADRDGHRGPRSSSPRLSATRSSAAAAAASSSDATKQLEAAGCTVQTVEALPSGDHSVLTPDGTSKKWNTDAADERPALPAVGDLGCVHGAAATRRRSCTTSSTAASSSSTARTCRRRRSTS